MIVDDEEACCEVLEMLLEKYCPEVNVVASCNSVAEAVKALSTYKVKLLFLDIEMPHANGFELLQKLPVIDFDLIFTTSYDQYAIKAIRFSALDYLLKPIDREELQAAVRKASERLQPPAHQQLEVLWQKIRKPSAVRQNIALPTMEGLQMVPVENIQYCESDSNYTIFYLKDKQKIIVSRTLKEIEELLEEFSFVRVHSSFLVNLHEVSKYVKGEGGYLILNDGTIVNVSASRKKLLLAKLQPGKM